VTTALRIRVHFPSLRVNTKLGRKGRTEKKAVPSRPDMGGVNGDELAVGWVNKNFSKRQSVTGRLKTLSRSSSREKETQYMKSFVSAS